MPYEILEKQINSLPSEAIVELSHYVEYLSIRYAKKEKEPSLTNKINDFFQKNSNSFNEFKIMEKANLSSIRELTKNDSW